MRLAALLAIAGWPIVLLLDTTIALSRGWEPSGRSWHVVVVASGALLLGALAATALPAGRRGLARHWAAIVTLALGLSLGVLAAEGVATIAPRFSESWISHSRGPGIRRVFRPDPSWITGISGESRYTTNSLGIRGLEPAPDARRLLCVGGSATECAFLDDSETWPHLVMERLGRAGRPVWVGNLGISGYATAEHLELLAHAPWELDGAIFLIGINDFLRFLNGSLEVGPRPFWRRTALLHAALALHRRAVLRRQFLEGEDERGESLHLRRTSRRDGEPAPPLPPLDVALREYRQHVADLAAICDRRKLECLFLTQPVLWRRDLGPSARARLWLGHDAHGRFLAPGELRRGMDRYNQALLATCAELGLDCLDLDDLSGHDDFFYDDCHLTEAGARVVARRVADHLLGN